MIWKMVLSVLILLVALYGWTVVLTARRHGRMHGALAALPNNAVKLGLAYSDSEPPDEVVRTFLGIDPTRRSPFFGDDDFKGVVTGTFRAVPVLGFVYWSDVDGVLAWEFVATTRSADRCPTVVAGSAAYPEGSIGLPPVPIEDDDFSARVTIYAQDAQFARALWGPEMRSFQQLNPFNFAAAGDRVFVTSSLPHSREELEARFLALLEFKNVVANALQSAG